MLFIIMARPLNEAAVSQPTASPIGCGFFTASLGVHHTPRHSSPHSPALHKELPPRHTEHRASGLRDAIRNDGHQVSVLQLPLREDLRLLQLRVLEAGTRPVLMRTKSWEFSQATAMGSGKRPPDDFCVVASRTPALTVLPITGERHQQGLAFPMPGDTPTQ